MISRDIIFQVDQFGVQEQQMQDAFHTFFNMCAVYLVKFEGHIRSWINPPEHWPLIRCKGSSKGKQSVLEVHIMHLRRSFQDRCYLWWKRGWRVPCCRDDGFWAKNTRGEVQLVVRSQSMSGGPVSLPETNIAPENGWLEYQFAFGAQRIFRCELLVSGSV